MGSRVEGEAGASSGVRPTQHHAEALALLLAQLSDPNLHFPELPRFVDGVSTFDMPDGLGIQFRGAEAPVLIRGQLVSQVLTYLRARMDGSRTVTEVLRDVPAGLSVVAVARTLLILHSKGLITVLAALPERDGFARRQQLYWGRNLAITRSSGSAPEVDRRIRAARVTLFGVGLFGSVVSDLLVRCGFNNLEVLGFEGDAPMSVLIVDGRPLPVRAVPAGDLDAALTVVRARAADADLVISATVDAPRRLLTGINDICQRTRTPWLVANCDGSAIDLGPLVYPGETACYQCLLLRQASASPSAVEDELFHEHLAGNPTPPSSTGEALWPVTLAASMLAGEATRSVSGIAPPTLTDAMLRVLPVSGFLHRNEIQRVPRCPRCFRGDVAPIDVPEHDDPDRPTARDGV